MISAISKAVFMRRCAFLIALIATGCAIADSPVIYTHGASTVKAVGGTGALQYANSTALAGDNTKLDYDSTDDAVLLSGRLQVGDTTFSHMGTFRVRIYSGSLNQTVLDVDSNNSTVGSGIQIRTWNGTVPTDTYELLTTGSGASQGSGRLNFRYTNNSTDLFQLDGPSKKVLVFDSANPTADIGSTAALLQVETNSTTRAADFRANVSDAAGTIENKNTSGWAGWALRDTLAGYRGGMFYGNSTVSVTNERSLLFINSVGDLGFEASDVEKARLTHSGHFLIGSATDNGTDALQVAGTVNSTGLTLTPVSLGTCDASHRGAITFQAGGAGVKDSLSLCAKDATDTYAWRTLY